MPKTWSHRGPHQPLMHTHARTHARARACAQHTRTRTRMRAAPPSHKAGSSPTAPAGPLAPPPPACNPSRHAREATAQGLQLSIAAAEHSAPSISSPRREVDRFDFIDRCGTRNTKELPSERSERGKVNSARTKKSFSQYERESRDVVHDDSGNLDPLGHDILIEPLRKTLESLDRSGSLAKANMKRRNPENRHGITEGEQTRTGLSATVNSVLYQIVTNHGNDHGASHVVRDFPCSHGFP